MISQIICILISTNKFSTCFATQNNRNNNNEITAREAIIRIKASCWLPVTCVHVSVCVKVGIKVLTRRFVQFARTAIEANENRCWLLFVCCVAVGRSVGALLIVGGGNCVWKQACSGWTQHHICGNIRTFATTSIYNNF